MKILIPCCKVDRYRLRDMYPAINVLKTLVNIFKKRNYAFNPRCLIPRLPGTMERLCMCHVLSPFSDEVLTCITIFLRGRMRGILLLTFAVLYCCIIQFIKEHTKVGIYLRLNMCMSDITHIPYKFFHLLNMLS